MSSSSISEKIAVNELERKDTGLLKEMSSSSNSVHEVEAGFKVGEDEEVYVISEEQIREQMKIYEDDIANRPLSATLKQRFVRLELVEVNFKNKRNMVLMLGTFAAFAGILSGIDQSIISGASIGMGKTLHLTSHENSLVSSLMPLGAVAGSILLTPLSEYLGRKFALVVSCIFYTIGAILCAAAHSVHTMYAGRFLIGVGVGIEGGGVGVYIAESVPSSVRGSLVSLYQFNIALGELFGYLIGVIFFDVKGGWRFMVGSSLVFSTILLVGLFFLPESPRWLIHKGHSTEAYKVWRRLRDISDLSTMREFLEMQQAAEQDKELKKHESKYQSMFDLVRIPRNRRALVYAIMMVSLGQLTGINAIMYYMSTLMKHIGFSQKRSVAMSMVGGAALLLGTIPAILYMDRFGRRPWSMTILGFIIGLILVGIGYKINLKTHLAAAEGVYLSGQILYNMFFGTYATLTWVVPSESFSLATRSAGMTVCSAFLYLWAFTVTYNFNRMQQAFTYTGLTLGFYGGIAVVIGIPYQLFFMPETKDKTLEEIDDIFNMPTRKLVAQNARNLRDFFAGKRKSI